MLLKIRRHYSLTTRYVVIVGLLLVTANIILGVVSTHQSRTAMMNMVRKSMLAVSNSAADLLDGDVMGALTEDDVGSPAYNDALEKLRVFQNNADIEYIYAVRQVGEGKYVFTMDADPVDPGLFGEEIVVTKAVVAAGNGIATVDDAPYSDRWGSFYSAFSPILDSNGNVAGIVGVDFSAEWYEHELYNHSTTIILLSILSVLFGAAVMLLITRKLRSKFQELDKGLSALARNLDALSEEISSNIGYKQSVSKDAKPAPETETLVNDEIEALGLKIHAMQRDMERYLDYVHAQAFTDSLTHVGNTNAYQEELQHLNKQIEDGSADFCALVFDIDNLKIVNDRFGHAEGDRIIRGAAAAIADVFGRDRTFRIGGDEFIAIPLGLTEAQVKSKLLSIDAAIDAFNASSVQPAAVLSLSSGVAFYRKGEDKSFRDIFIRADEAMYETKGEHHRRMSVLNAM